MRFASLLLLLFVVPTAACIFDDHCSGDARVASSTPPLTGAALDQWNHSTCSTDEDDLCRRGIPLNNELELCQHQPDVVLVHGAPFMALTCHYYSLDKSCRSSPSHHHDD